MSRFLDPAQPERDTIDLSARQIASALAPIIGEEERANPIDREALDGAVKAIWQDALKRGDQVHFPTLGQLFTGGSKKLDAEADKTTLKPPIMRRSTYAIHPRQFYNREYVIGLGLFTMVSAVGWYYIFFTGSLAGLNVFIVQGSASADALSAYLTHNIAPLTSAFIGAWLFSITMLVHNWSLDDLYPRSYFYAAIRLIIGLLVGLLLANLLATDTTVGDIRHISADLAAFVISILPFDFLGLLIQQTAAILFAPDTPQVDPHDRGSKESESLPVDGFRIAWSSRHRPQELDDLTVWDEARLAQEGIDSIHTLAMANLEGLIIDTPYQGDTIADWIDQALLYMHTPHELSKPLQACPAFAPPPTS